METVIVGAVLIGLIFGATVMATRSRRRRGGAGDGVYTDENYHRSRYDGDSGGDGGDGGGD